MIIKKICELDFNDFKECIKKVSPAVSKDDTRPIFTCYLLELENNYMTLSSIDGYRLATNKLYYKNDTNKNYILPANILNIITGIKSNKNVEIFEGNKYIKIIIDNISLYINQVAGEFIQYKNLLSKDYNTKIQINDVKKLYNTLKGFKDACKNSRNKEIILNIKEDKICIQDLNNTMLNEFKIDNKTGDDLIIAFNLLYLLEGLKSINGHTELTFTSNVNPIIIKNINYTYLLLPVRISH